MKKYLLLTILLSLSILLLASCADTKKSSEDNNSETETEQSTETKDALIPTYNDENYNNADFRIIYPSLSQNYAYQQAEEMNGEIVNDALFDRDKTVEEQFNITIKYTGVGGIENVYPQVFQDVMAGDNTFELVLNHVNWDLVSYVESKIVLDWYDIPKVDFSKPYWNQNMNESLAIHETLPFAASDFVLGNPYLMLFNKNIIENYDLDSPYELVENGKWAWDEVISMCNKVTYDVNGDGVMDAEDAYGFVIDISGSSSMLRNVPSACGEYIYKRDSNGDIICTVNTERTQVLLEKMISLFYDGGGYLLKYGATREMPDQVRYFNKNTYLFYLCESLLAEHFRAVDFEYGIVPFPKYDEKQEDYYALNWSGLMLIPITVKDTEYIGTIVEWFSYYNSVTVLPEYFNTLMDAKVARDDKSAKMLKLIFNSLVYDPGINFKSSKFYAFFDEMIIYKQSGLQSYYESRENAEIEYIKKINDMFLDFKNIE